MCAMASLFIEKMELPGISPVCCPECNGFTVTPLPKCQQFPRVWGSRFMIPCSLQGDCRDFPRGRDYIWLPNQSPWTLFTFRGSHINNSLFCAFFLNVKKISLKIFFFRFVGYLFAAIQFGAGHQLCMCFCILRWSSLHVSLLTFLCVNCTKR